MESKQNDDYLKIAPSTLQKIIEKHGLNRRDIIECFTNRECSDLIDNRENHKTNPPTLWFISENNYGKRIKIVYLNINGLLVIKSAFVPNAEEIRIYDKIATPV